MELWLQERESRREALYQKAQRTGSQADIAEWERYARQTARMQTMASQLDSTLAQPFAVAHGRRLTYQGREIYLEHLVVGPTGIFLIESAEASPEWRDDLARSIAFFLQSLGSESGRFTCLVVARDQQGLDRLPAGAHLVHSLDAALHVIRDERGGDPLPPATAQEMWRIIQSMEARGPIREADGRIPYLKRATWRELVVLISTAVVNLLIWEPEMGEGVGDLVLGFFILIPFMMFWAGLIMLIPNNGWRKGLSYTYMVVTILLTLLITIGRFAA